jgi:hypothetical protein
MPKAKGAGNKKNPKPKLVTARELQRRLDKTGRDMVKSAIKNRLPMSDRPSFSPREYEAARKQMQIEFLVAPFERIDALTHIESLPSLVKFWGTQLAAMTGDLSKTRVLGRGAGIGFSDGCEIKMPGFTQELPDAPKVGPGREG